MYRGEKLQGSLLELSAPPTATEMGKLHALLLNFLNWAPLPPATPKALAETLAPLCGLLRKQVNEALQDENSNLHLLSKNIKENLFPDAEQFEFADIYAQTLTYALLLAKLSGASPLTADEAVKKLSSGHALLSSVLQNMAHPAARAEVDTAVSMLERIIDAVEPAKLQKRGDPWLYFYEDFLAVYDKKLRNDRGVYYTPTEVIQCQVRLAGQLLKERFKKPLTFADPEVVFLDPAAGTGAYPLAAVEYALSDAFARYGEGLVAGHATTCAGNIHAFELLVGPYAVAHLRLSQALTGYGATLPKDGVRVYLTDTLESPHREVPPSNLYAKTLTDEHKRAAQVKKKKRVWVMLGNPPYDREEHDPSKPVKKHERKGGWVRHGDLENKKHDEEKLRPILQDFIETAQRMGQGVHIHNLYNDYVYFWRWALWKMFENEEPEASGPGILSFITASSYLRGPAFVGLR